MKKIISMVLSFILILGCSTTAFAAETHNYDTENLPHDGADYFETEIKADEENEERISDFVTVYGYQYTKGSLKSGAWRNGTSGGSSTSSAKLSLNYTQDTSYNISFYRYGYLNFLSFFFNTQSNINFCFWCEKSV